MFACRQAVELSAPELQST